MGPRRGHSRPKVVPNPAEEPLGAPEESASSLDLVETEQADELQEEEASRGKGSKGRGRRQREQLTNRPVPAGQQRKGASKVRASLAKRRRREQKTAKGRAKKPIKAKAAKKLTDEDLSL